MSTAVTLAVTALPALADRPNGSDFADKNILLVITDDESTTLGCYGDPVARTAHVDALANDGVRFTNAFATTASCSASRSVVLSGVHNHKNGQYGHQHHYHKFSSYFDVASLSLPRVLANAGYRTARCGKFHVAPEAVYHFEITIPGAGRDAVKAAENCREFLEDRTDSRPFFLYFATNDPHRSGQTDESSKLEWKPDLFGNLPNQRRLPGVETPLFDPAEVPVPEFLPDTAESREELAHYYQACTRADAGLGRLIEVLKSAGLFSKTLILFTSDHGMAFPGAKTTVYDPGLRVPLVVRDPYQERRGLVADALVSHVDIAPTLVDFAGALDPTVNGPTNWRDPRRLWQSDNYAANENRNGGNRFRSYQGKSWLPILGDPAATVREALFASHTFHEITMYYPMRVVRDRRYKLIWNIAHDLEFPFASDLWDSSTWQAQLHKRPKAAFGARSVEAFLRRPEFELYDIVNDPAESRNLAQSPEHAATLKLYQDKLREQQHALEDPWVLKWEYE